MLSHTSFKCAKLCPYFYILTGSLFWEKNKRNQRKSLRGANFLWHFFQGGHLTAWKWNLCNYSSFLLFCVFIFDLQQQLSSYVFFFCMRTKLFFSLLLLLSLLFVNESTAHQGSTQQTQQPNAFMLITGDFMLPWTEHRLISLSIWTASLDPPGRSDHNQVLLSPRYLFYSIHWVESSGEEESLLV